MQSPADGSGNALLFPRPCPLRPLTAREKRRLTRYIPEVDLDNAWLRDDKVPWYLRRKFRGITRGNRIYFRPGAFDPDTIPGLALLAHELVHVGQYRQGMNWLKYLWSARHGYYHSKYEKEARAVQKKVLIELADNDETGCDPSAIQRAESDHAGRRS